MNAKKKNQLVWGAIIVGAGLYILNLGFGFVELVPDNAPLIGNLDEAGAALLIVKGLKKFGVDLTK